VDILGSVVAVPNVNTLAMTMAVPPIRILPDLHQDFARKSIDARILESNWNVFVGRPPKKMEGEPLVATLNVVRSISASISSLLGGGSFAFFKPVRLVPGYPLPKQARYIFENDAWYLEVPGETPEQTARTRVLYEQLFASTGGH